jgi:putative membrane protein
MAAPLSLSAQDHARISAAVTAAEASSAGEIVTILAERSDGYTDVALSWAALAAIATLAALAVAPEAFLEPYAWLRGGWVSEWSIRDALLVAVVVTVSEFLAVLLIQLWPPFKFWLVPPPIKSLRVRDQAVRAFRIGAERRTQGRTGILIYLSMRERRAEIVADEAIASRVEPEVWADAMAAMLNQVRKGHVADGMIAAIERVGAIVTEHFPRPENDQNELPDRVIEV